MVGPGTECSQKKFEKLVGPKRGFSTGFLKYKEKYFFEFFS
jgi:hypothetical protein